MPAGAVLLIEDETILRLFPPLRACWALRGEQAVVPITGQNAKRVLFGVINPRTGLCAFNAEGLSFLSNMMGLPWK